jgi:very-short-patch-repair endonuclease
MEASPVNEDLKLELERMRSRLLDLSGRNPLLNYGHPRASSLRIVDEVPALVLEKLTVSGSFRFAPLDAEDAPAPIRERNRRPFGRRSAADLPLLDADSDGTATGDAALQSLSDKDRREAAKAARAAREAGIQARAVELGINPSYDLAAVGDSNEAQHGDRKLQTLLAPDELEARLQKLQASAVTSIQESGANMLHLLFGLIEWTDTGTGKSRYAPLVLLPVTLSRLGLDSATHTFPYTVAASGEDWSTNVTLQELCLKQFGFVLPSIEEDDNLETYFARVEDVLHSAPAGWRVRRQLTLGLVSFGKILMWRDLDPASWPEERPLFGNPLFREVLGADESKLITDDDDDSGGTRTTEYNIDALPPELGKVPPIVVAADSSQHSVLVDVQRGENLVVQGPPGTGKSQTITNMIADAIAAGKKVLFVAEKKAALEVVARRLTDAGLGAFCLPLHSHTSNKREFLDGLKERIDIKGLGDSSAEMATIEGLLTETRADLTGHVDRLHESFGSLGDSAFSILWRVRRLSSELPEAVLTAVRGLTISNAVAVTQGDAARQRGVLTSFAAAHAAARADADSTGQHPWLGVTRADLSFDDTETLLALTRAARDAFSDAEQARANVMAASGGAEWGGSPESMAPLLDRTDALVPPHDAVSAALIESTQQRAGASSVQAAVAAADKARLAWAQVTGPWRTPGALTPSMLADFSARLTDAERVFGAGRAVEFPANIALTIEQIIARLTECETLAVQWARELGITAPMPIGVALRLMDAVVAAGTLPEGALELRSPVIALPNAAERVEGLASKAAALVTEGARMDARFAPEMRPSPTELREMAGALADAPRFFPSLFSGAYRRAVSQFRRMSGGVDADRATMTADVGALLRHMTAFKAFVDDPALPALFGPSADGVRSPFTSMKALVTWAKSATASFKGSGEVGRLLTEAVWNAPARTWSEAAAVASGNDRSVSAAGKLRASLMLLANVTPASLATWDSDSFAVLRDLLMQWHGIAVRAAEVVQSAGAQKGDSMSGLLATLHALAAAWAADAELALHQPTFEELGLRVPELRGADGADALPAVRGALTYLSQFREPGLPTVLVDWLTSGDQRARLASLKAATALLRAAMERANAAEGKFSVGGGIDLSVWYAGDQGPASLGMRVARYDRAIAAGNSLARYGTWLRARHAVATGPLPIQSELLEGGIVPGAQIADVYDYVLARTLAEQVLRTHPELDRFSGALHETRRAQFAALDEQFITLTRKIIAQQANATVRIRGVSWGPVKDLTEQSLIEHEIGKTRRHIPIREMFKRAGRAIQSLKPCIMMGPQAVAQYLPPGLFHFDLVVMDEASQMRPEDALGAIARGSQFVVVGDPKQLGPTSFFDAQTSDEGEIDEAAAVIAAESAAKEMPRGASVLERSESILLAAARRYPVRMLRWHYRSKYPELIAFSNQEFYNNELVLFPHPGSELPGDGLNFVAVEKAVYGASINRVEADALIAAVKRHVVESPDRTLILVTMNKPQKDLVNALLLEAEKDDPAISAFRARHAETLEPLDVKNLENVQGDERDVVYISVTYGPNANGVVSQGFGPINTTGGERRLNVLFTRAKFRMDVFCSFDPTMLRVTESSPRGLCVFRDFLRFAREKSLSTGRFTAREPDSDFEVEVARALRAQGYDVHPQVGVAGYFLDLAVVDPKRPGRYVLAIECDGATYHSAKSARDRDRLRQGVLEGLGWKVHRIWSTDWFRDPRGETLKVARRIESLV